MMSKLGAHLARHSIWYGIALPILYFGYFMLPARDKANEFHVRQFGRLPAYDGGRYKPLDTVARNNLMILTHRQSYYDAKQGKSYPATKWLLDVFATPNPMDRDLVKALPNHGDAWDHDVFRIENDQVLTMLGLKMKERLRYSLKDIAPGVSKLFEEATRIMGDDDQDIRGIDPQHWTLKDAKVVELAQHVRLFLRLSGLTTPLLIPDPAGTDQWRTFRSQLDEVMNAGQFNGGVAGNTFKVYFELLTYYQEVEVQKFNDLLDKHLAELEKESPAKMRALDTEVFFNEFAPFYRCLEVYVVLALLIGFSWLASPAWSEPLRKGAFAAMAVVVVFHFSGLILRMYLQNRWYVFVTNLYSSAVFIGFGCVLVCLIAEYFYRNGIAIVVGSVTGFCTLIIAHMLSLDGDTMVMMQAVLDTNFWLATHVTCVTLGYTMAFVAGFMGIAYVLLGIFTDKLRRDGAANLARMTYGVLCAGMFLSFVGTVLGGLWADYSWGRFWGWDPKENGALLIVIWIALILHARWGGMVKQRGIAVLCVLGNIVTSWSWFGTNFLGVGLHAYGGAKADSMLALILIDLLFLMIAGLGCIPLNMWQSFRPADAAGSGTSPPLNPTGITAKPKLA
jgi:ABC-type transport system involved in cytochrome c biogenesis permease subunit